ncbi:MAG: DUF6438 domain-containing protein [Saprospiraceae bacterium]
MKPTQLVWLLAAALLACKGPKKMADPNAKLVQLETAGCRGFCPIYRLTFWQNGKAEFEGIQFTAQTGLRNFTLDPTELAGLQQLVAETNLWQYPDRFQSTVADAPSATLTVWDGPKTKSTLGSIDRPQPLLALEAHLKSLAEKHGLQVRRGVAPNEPAPGTRAEILLQLKDDVNAGNWLQQFEDFRLRLVRRIPPNNTWVVAYDRSQIEEPALLDLLKNMDGCLNAQPNKLANDRN